MLQKWESWGEVCLVESSAEPESLEAVQINLLQDRPQLDVEVHQNGRELLSSTALKRGKGNQVSHSQFSHPSSCSTPLRLGLSVYNSHIYYRTTGQDVAQEMEGKGKVSNS